MNIKSLPHTCITEDQIIVPIKRIYSVCKSSDLVGNMISLYPVTIRILQTNTTPYVLPNYAVGYKVAIALAQQTKEINAVISIPTDSAVGNRITITLTIASVKMDAITGVVSHHKLLKPTTLTVFHLNAIIKVRHNSISHHNIPDRTVGFTVKTDAVIVVAIIPA